MLEDKTSENNSKESVEGISLRAYHNELADLLNVKNRQLVNSNRKLIGEILVDMGAMTEDQVELVLDQQDGTNKTKTSNLFGEIAIKKGYINKITLLHALSFQYGYKTHAFNKSELDKSLVAAHQPFSQESENYRKIRVLVLEWFQTNSKPLCLLSTSRGDGRSQFLANLAITLSQANKKVLLIDADLRNPTLQNAFAIDNSCGLSGLLSGQTKGEVSYAIEGFPNLNVIPSGPLSPNPQELLSQPFFSVLLEKAAESFDIVLIDTPSLQNYSDAELIASVSGAALILARKNHTRVKELKTMCNRLKYLNISTIGTVLSSH